MEQYSQVRGFSKQKTGFTKWCHKNFIQCG